MSLGILYIVYLYIYILFILIWPQSEESNKGRDRIIKATFCDGSRPIRRVLRVLPWGQTVPCCAVSSILKRIKLDSLVRLGVSASRPQLRTESAHYLLKSLHDRRSTEKLSLS